MNLFLKRAFFFLLFVFILLELISFGLRKTGLFESYISGSEIYQSLRVSQQKNTAKSVLIGDSVGKQLFRNTGNPYLPSLACNRAISMAGHYFLLKNYIEAGNELDTAYLVFTPFSFKNNLDEIYTYHYFLKPFGNSKYRPHFTTTVEQQLQKIPSKSFLWSQYILATDWAPSFTSKDKIEHSFLSPISIEYLTKIKAFATQHNFELRLLPAPIRNDRKEEFKEMDFTEMKGHNFEKELTFLVNNVAYFDNDYFVDKEHIRKEIQVILAKLYFEKYMENKE